MAVCGEQRRGEYQPFHIAKIFRHRIFVQSHEAFSWYPTSIFLVKNFLTYKTEKSGGSGAKIILDLFNQLCTDLKHRCVDLVLPQPTAEGGAYCSLLICFPSLICFTRRLSVQPRGIGNHHAESTRVGPDT